jgi:excisionase family DNA binding protein
MAKLPKPPGPGFVTVAELARELGVSRQAIEKAIAAGRLVAYDRNGKPWADGTWPRRRKPVSRNSGAGRTGGSG